MPTENEAILIVDDEPNVISALRRGLADEPYLTAGAESAELALELMGRQRFNVVISDEKMPGMDGAAFLARVRVDHPEVIRIMLTGHASLEAAMRAVNGGEIYRFFTKPWDDIELRLAIRGALEKYRLEQENRRLLKTVRHQSQELKRLERCFPGISELRRDPRGAIFVDAEVSDEEIARVIAKCNAGRP